MSTDLVALPTAPGPVVRTAPVEDVAAALAEYQQLCDRILEVPDWQDAGSEGRFLKRSGWRKLALAFSVTLERVESEIERDDKGRVIWVRYLARATAQNGRSATGEGYCDRFERRFARGVAKDHDIIATAETRAKSRASADLFGLGAVSAEELGDVDPKVPDPPKPAAKPNGASGCEACGGAGERKLASGTFVTCPACHGGKK